MTDSLFFDSDCISAFLWVNGQNILSQLYAGKIIIPKQSYKELSYPTTPHLKQRVDALIASGDAQLYDMDINSEEYKLYIQMTTNPEDGYKTIGDGEAASIALAKEQNGILASNNLRDVSHYISKYKLSHVTTGDILVEAMKKGLINEAQGNAIWASMLAKWRKLGAATFSDYLKMNR
jgi:predicted nucleic acid-binding protein